MNSPPTTCCIVNYNGAAVLSRVLEVVCEPAFGAAELLLVDNGSTDDSIALVERSFPRVRVICLPANLGPGAARNAGFREARNARILFVDNDVIAEPAMLKRLHEALDRSPRAAVALPRVVFAADPQIVQYDGGDSHYLGVLASRNAGTLVAAAPVDIRPLGSVISAAFLMDRSRWKAGEPFDESFFIYLEDHDFGLRARMAGSEILLVPEARCRHMEGTAGLSLRREGTYARDRVFYLIRNRWQVLLKNYQLATLAKLAPMLLVYEAFQLAGVVRKGWFPAWLAAAWWIMRHPAIIWRKRRAVQRARAVPDRHLLTGGRVPFAPQLIQGRSEAIALEALHRMTSAYWSVVRRLL